MIWDGWLEPNEQVGDVMVLGTTSFSQVSRDLVGCWWAGDVAIHLGGAGGCFYWREKWGVIRFGGRLCVGIKTRSASGMYLV